MLSSAGQPGDAVRCRELGMAGYLTKPITQSELWDAILIALATSAPARAPMPLITRHVLRESRRRFHLLLAEDNPVNQQLAVRLLEKQGHSVVVVGDGRQGLAALERERFDLVLMDVQMPEMDGLEATAAIRQYESEVAAGDRQPPVESTFAGRRRLPIVAMTAHAMKGDEERCLAVGMDGYVSKPMKPETLFAAIERLLPDEVAPPPPPSLPARVPIDLTEALGMVDGDRALLRELASLLVEDCPHRIQELRGAVEAGDAPRIERAAHAVKGAVATFGAAGVHQRAAELETIGREARVAAAPAVLAALEVEVERLIAFLTAPGWEEPASGA